ncbi:hypothetical protein RFN58_08510 [Streptomyces iakyrus]|uniref:hypothetical protein n=1 Tax=Streptomyces iakyrus TaxID=68219 RepID=UPI00052626AB|nr:hypothetical protein [Streptomyces iakyrus]
MAGTPGGQRPGRHPGALGDQGSGSHERAGADQHPIHEDGARTDEDVVFNSAAGNDGGVADADPTADGGQDAGVGVQDAFVLQLLSAPNQMLGPPSTSTLPTRFALPAIQAFAATWGVLPSKEMITVLSLGVRGPKTGIVLATSG